MGRVVYIVMILIVALSVHSNVVKIDEITTLTQKLHDQQADNENLRFQYNQCKILYIGM